MRNVKDKLRSIAQQGKYGAYLRMFLSDAGRVTKYGCTVDMDRRSGNKAAFFHVSWKEPNGPFASELKEIADKANAKKINQSQDAE